MKIQKTEVKMFDILRGKNKDIVEDGIIDEVHYNLSPIKINYILKEVNGGKGWNLKTYVAGGGRASTWNNIARWTEGINNLNKNLKWKDLIDNNEERRLNYLKSIGVINLKKTSGTYVSNNKKVLEEAIKNQDFLKNQIKLYDPDIIICCGTGVMVEKSIFSDVKIEWLTTSRGIDYFKHNNYVVISYHHPQTRVSSSILYYGLIDAVKEIMKDNLASNN